MAAFAFLRFFFCLGLLLWSGGIFAQNTTNSLKFEHITLEQGLSHAQTRYVMQDSKGFIWIASANGLNKYDGYRFTVYTHDPRRSNSISHNKIYCIYEDKAQVLWIGTSYGLNRFDRVTETFTRYIPQKDTVGYNIINMVHEDAAGNFWVATNGGGLSLFDRKTGIFKPYRHDPGNENSLGKSNKVKDVKSDRQGNLWIATDDGLSLLSPENSPTGKFIHFRHDDSNPRSLCHNYIKSITEDRQGNLWLGTDGGMALLTAAHKKTGIFTNFVHDPANPQSLSNNYVKNVLVDEQDMIWVVSDGGLSRMRPQNRAAGIFENFYHVEGNPSTLAINYLKHIYQDQSGILWLANDGGVDRFDKNTEQFTTYQYQPGNPLSLINSNVRGITCDAQGTLWIGTNGGLFSLKPEHRSRGIFTNYQNEPAKPGTLINNYISVTFTDRSGQLWVGTDGGLSCRNADGTFTSFLPAPVNPQSLLHKAILSLYEDPQENLWIGSWWGLSLLRKEDKAKGVFTNYDRAYFKIHSGKIKCIEGDTQGRLWLGSDEGLIRFDPKTGDFVKYVHDAAQPWSLNENDIFSIAQAKDGHWWIGTGGGGINYFDPSRGRFRSFSEKEGLISNFVFGIMPDQNGNLWISTNKGISRFTPPAHPFDLRENGIFRNFDQSDGLQDNEFFVGSFYKSPSGEMFFGGRKGFNSFFPEKIVEKNYIPPVYLTDFKLFNRSIEVSDSTLISQHINFTTQVELACSDNFFSFEFAALNYRNSSRNLYAYKLEGFDKEWVYKTAGDRTATYTNLSPGEYTFMVKGSNNYGLWNPEPARLRIVVVPPFWQTWWFRILISVVAVVGATGIYQYRISSIEMRKKVLERQVSERTSELAAKNAELEQQKEEIQTQRDDISDKNTELLSAYEEISVQKLEIEQAKTLIEQKNSRILDSIRYAKTIQQSILPKDREMVSSFAGFFVIYRPKDVVSGDFYWLDTVENKIFIGVLDCTGHGVPGAFMSLIGYALLNEIVNAGRIFSPAAILEELHHKMRTTLKQEEGHSEYGMEGGICVIEGAGSHRKITFAGAKGLLYTFQDQKLEEWKGTRRSIGSDDEQMPFTEQVFELVRGDRFYMSTDGFTDQNDGQRERFGTARFRRLLADTAQLSMEEQKYALVAALEGFQQQEAQRDDITVMGVEV